CLEGRRPDEVRKIILTASGGPFRLWEKEKILLTVSQNSRSNRATVLFERYLWEYEHHSASVTSCASQSPSPSASGWATALPVPKISRPLTPVSVRLRSTRSLRNRRT
ncbi:MAG: hypothetical protein J6J51_06440, partial [Clostridia bacterium]|nr:hypothetical protein [Clostridia bacterium]